MYLQTAHQFIRDPRDEIGGKREESATCFQGLDFEFRISKQLLEREAGKAIKIPWWHMFAKTQWAGEEEKPIRSDDAAKFFKQLRCFKYMFDDFDTDCRIGPIPSTGHHPDIGNYIKTGMAGMFVSAIQREVSLFCKVMSIMSAACANIDYPCAG